MKKQPSDGRSSAHAALLLWLGFTVGSFVAPVISKPDAVKDSAETDLFSEMFADIHRGFDNRLAFEAWADAR